MNRTFLVLTHFFMLTWLLLIATTIHAATLEVGAGKPYTKIQSAINDAVNDDTILVYDGTYVENIYFYGKAITVKSVNGAASTTIDGNASGTVVTFVMGEGSGSVLEGFTIRNGNDSGIYCNTSSPTITNCTITGNMAGHGFGGGIHCASSSSTITNCTITGNSASYGGGIACYAPSSLTITNCTISGNTADLLGGGIYCQSSSPTITNCIVTENTVSIYGGGGIYCLDSSPTINGCNITGNTAFNGGGIFCEFSSPVITNCTVTGNMAMNWGGGIACYSSSSAVITNCTVTGNTATSAAGGIANAGSASAVIINCTITGNTASDYGGGGIASEDSSVTVVNTILWGDIAPMSKEILLLTGSTITVTYSDVEGGWTGTGNINADPLFVGNGDYHLTAGSPCIDKGTSEGAPSYDIDGDTRPQGAGYDIGSDEYYGYTTVNIDIKPGGFPNSINLKSKGNVPVAILSSPTFDAATVDRGTVVFAGAPALSIGGTPEDVNGDGLLDLVLHFSTQSLNLNSGDTEACLTGKTLSGQDFKGCDSVNIVK